ncbi:MAG TPA: hypothetical protein PKD55_06320 [Bellilinea sp.]|nr:hypothetical protein [Bellilinea sp.]
MIPATPKGKNLFVESIDASDGRSVEQLLIDLDAAKIDNTFTLISEDLTQFNTNFDGTDKLKYAYKLIKETSRGAWCWHKLALDQAVKEAEGVIQRVVALEPEGLVLEAPIDFSKKDKLLETKQFMTRLRRSFPDLALALCSPKFPSFHVNFPWQEFLSAVNFVFPKVFWEQAHNPASNLTRSFREFSALTPYRSFTPTVPAFASGKWYPNETDFEQLKKWVNENHVLGVNFYSWDTAVAARETLWPMICDFSLTNTQSIDPVISELFESFNQHNLAGVETCYLIDAVRLANNRSSQGLPAISDAIANWLEKMPGAKFTVTGVSFAKNARNVTWTMRSESGSIEDGNDTFGLMDGKIAFHSSTFTLT